MLIDARYELIDTDNVKDTDEVLVTGMEFKNWMEHLGDENCPISATKDEILECLANLQKSWNKFEKSIRESVQKLQDLNKNNFEDLHNTIESAKLNIGQSPYTNTCGSNNIDKWQNEQIDKMMEYFK